MKVTWTQAYQYLESDYDKRNSSKWLITIVYIAGDIGQRDDSYSRHPCGVMAQDSSHYSGQYAIES
jgi:hypothetical protein